MPVTGRRGDPAPILLAPAALAALFAVDGQLRHVGGRPAQYGALALVLAAWAVAVLGARRHRSEPLVAPTIVAVALATLVAQRWGDLASIATATAAAVVGGRHLTGGPLRPGLSWRAWRPLLPLLGWSVVLIGTALDKLWPARIATPIRSLGSAAATAVVLVAMTAGSTPPRISAVAPTAGPAPGPAAGRSARARAGRVVLASLAVVCVVVGAYGQVRQWEMNDDPTAGDQGAYLAGAAGLAGPPYAGGARWYDRNRMPLYPLLVAQVIDPDAAEAGWFDAGKAIGVAIGIAGTAATAWLLLRRFGPTVASAATAIVWLTVVSFKAPWSQADLLSYFLLALAAAGCWRLLRSPDPFVGAATGVALGLAYLTKASAGPMIAAVSATAAAGLVLPSRWSGLPSAARRRLALALALLVALLALTIAPYAVGNERHMGSPLYNDNTSVFGWADSWPEAYRAVLTDAAGQPLVAPADRPSLHRYLDTHDAGDIAARFRDGLRTNWTLTQRSYGYASQVVLLAVAAVVAVAAARPSLRRRRLPLAFAGATVVAYALTAAWWAPISEGERFILPLVVAVIAFLVAVVERGGRERWVEVAGRGVRLSHLLLGGQLALLMWQLPGIALQLGRYPGGS